MHNWCLLISCWGNLKNRKIENRRNRRIEKSNIDKSNIEKSKIGERVATHDYDDNTDGGHDHNDDTV